MPESLCIFGCGYVGLTTAAVMAGWGHAVEAVDIDERRVTQLAAGRLPFWEPGLESLVGEGLAGGRLTFSTDGMGAAARSTVTIIAVGTPGLPDGRPDLRALEAALRTISAAPGGAGVVVVKSTVPPGTNQRYAPWLPGRHLVSHPEFLRQGSALEDLLRPARRVIGARSEAAARRVERLYPDDGPPSVITDPASAELAKYGANGLLAAKLSFVNALARLCEPLGADIQDVARIMGLDPRIGPAFLQASIGFGGSCLPKDSRALIETARDLGLRFPPAEAALAVNEEQAVWFASKVIDLLPENPVIAAGGLAFKAGTDDLRESPALRVIAALQGRGATVRAYDPMARESPPGVLRCASLEEAATGADGLVLLTEWPEFRQQDWGHLARAMRGRHLFDGRNLADPAAVAAAGLVWVPLGRPSGREGDAP